MVQLQERARHMSTADGLMVRLEAIPAYLPIRMLGEHLLSGSQQDYPVVDNGTLVGILRRDELLEALGNVQDATVGEVLRGQRSQEEPFVGNRR